MTTPMNVMGKQDLAQPIVIPAEQFFTFTEGTVFNAAKGLVLLAPILAMVNLTFSLIVVAMIVVALVLQWADRVAYSELFLETGMLRQHQSFRPMTRFTEIQLKDYPFIQLDLGVKHKYVRYVYLAISGQHGQVVISTFGLRDKRIDENNQLPIPCEAKALKALLIEKFHFRDIGTCRP